MTTIPRGERAASRLDPWALAPAAAALLPLLKLWGAPVGEPVADDYDFLHHALLAPGRLLDGGGALIYWRPLARQIYYAAAGPLMLSHPLAIALLHVLLLAASAVLIQRALAPSLGGPRAAVAATFPVVADSARTLILWPSAIQDLGALFFVSLALFETTRRRLPTAMLAVLAALLCKELTAFPALLLPWAPEVAGAPKRQRRRWAIAIGATIGAWAILYAFVLRSAHLMVQSQLEGARPPLLTRLTWALGSSLADGFNLRGVPMIAVAIAALALAVAAFLARRGRRTDWLVFGGVWFVLCSATLSETYPGWGSFRSTLGIAGLGIAMAAMLGEAGRVGLWLVAGARIVLLLLAPAVPSRITLEPPGDGSGFDVVTISRLQRFARETRQALRPAEAALPSGSAVAWLHRPLMSERAFAHSQALQVWYRDSTLTWAEGGNLEDETRLVSVGLEYDAEASPQIVRVAQPALEQLTAAVQAMRHDQVAAALADLARADSLQKDRGAHVFLAQVAGKAALCLLVLDQPSRGEQEARRSLALWRGGADARYVIAVLLASQGKRVEAIAQLDTVLSFYPFDRPSRMFRDTLQAGAGAP